MFFILFAGILFQEKLRIYFLITVSSNFLMILPDLTVMVVLPAFFAVILPFVVILATVVLDDL